MLPSLVGAASPAATSFHRRDFSIPITVDGSPHSGQGLRLLLKTAAWWCSAFSAPAPRSHPAASTWSATWAAGNLEQGSPGKHSHESDQRAAEPARRDPQPYRYDQPTVIT